MARTVAIGADGFAGIRERGNLYIDKTGFVRRWWEQEDKITLVTRPRRFGKTLALDTVNCFFSTLYADRADLFEGLAVWTEPAIRAEQGAWPVIFLSFADVKESSFETARSAINRAIAEECRRHVPELDLAGADPELVSMFGQIGPDMDEVVAARSVKTLCELMRSRHGKNAIVLLDEYDAPFQEAWLGGYWDQMISFTRALFNATFKTNRFIERGLITGVTCITQESIFSDLNNLRAVTATTPLYEDCFGFTQDEVFAVMDEMGRTDRDGVRRWYDGFKFGGVDGIYNPWSITNYLADGRLLPYWANTSGNGLVSSLVRKGDPSLKDDFATLLAGGMVKKVIGEHVTFAELEHNTDAVWPLLLATGYVKVIDALTPDEGGEYTLKLTNRESHVIFENAVRGWFRPAQDNYNGFVRALLACDVPQMNAYMNRVALDTFSSFDSGTHPAESEPERFYHGFVLGLLVELKGRYAVLSNRESGFGRYDVVLEPLDPRADDAFVLEFKVFDPQWGGETSLQDTVDAALAQIEKRGYAADLLAKGIAAERIHALGFAFQGKRVLIG